MTPLHRFRAARVLLEGAQASIEHVISREANPVVVEQQSAWIVGELEHAIQQVKQAQVPAVQLQAKPRRAA